MGEITIRDLLTMQEGLDAKQKFMARNNIEEALLESRFNQAEYEKVVYGESAPTILTYLITRVYGRSALCK